MDFEVARDLQRQYNEKAKTYSDSLQTVHQKYKGELRGLNTAYHEELLAVEAPWTAFCKELWPKFKEASVITQEEREAFLQEYATLMRKHHLQFQDCGDYCVGNPHPCIAISLE